MMGITIIMLDLLQLLQLADSALPIGASAHSFGLETLTAEGDLTPEMLTAFFADMLMETAPLEAAYCCRAYQLAEAIPTLTPTASTEFLPEFLPEWLALNQTLSARKPARESREASTTLGKRFLRLVASFEPLPQLQVLLQNGDVTRGETHHCIAFGLVGGFLNLGEEAVALAYLQQSLTGLLSACQRLMPVGQNQAIALGWQLKPLLAQIVRESLQTDPDNVYSFAPMLDLAGMRHANLPVRLFIS